MPLGFTQFPLSRQGLQDIAMFLIAGAILFLLSDLARAVTGEILHVDGGFHAMGTALAPVAQEAVA